MNPKNCYLIPLVIAHPLESMRLRVASPPDAKYLPLIEHSRAVSRSFCLPTQIHLKYNETTPTEGKLTPLGEL